MMKRSLGWRKSDAMFRPGTVCGTARSLADDYGLRVDDNSPPLSLCSATEEAPAQCINLGASGCESQDECCSANDLNENVKCWDERCCNKTEQPCARDT